MGNAPQKPIDRRLSVAPMMDWTDRHCRFFHRQFSRQTLLYTEMVTAPAILYGDVGRLLHFDPAEHPVALQLGGSDPDELAKATRITCEAGYDEINLNCGCPSDRVQSGTFGAVLMKSPDRVADCVTAMIEASTGPEITIKCRIGVDEQEPREVLPRFIETVASAGVRSFAIHARKAWLQGLSPKENRDIPPLDYPLALEIKRAFPELEICLNGGIVSLEQARQHLMDGFDGVMIGRAAYHDPGGILGRADADVFGQGAPVAAEVAVVAMLPYIERELSAGTRLNQITRHMLGAFAGRPGARAWRRILSENAHLPGVGPELVIRAMDAVARQAA